MNFWAGILVISDAKTRVLIRRTFLSAYPRPQQSVQAVRQQETNTDKSPWRRGRIPDRIIFKEGLPKGDGKASGAPISGSTSFSGGGPPGFRGPSRITYCLY
ncbi:hypothetical protein CEXT_275621 [Caerostris extrusa]|uniref:Uncharacterized protein n=1 Tax=Caerostris extrusa TaxID=172846 RepID=A0AAV4PFV4_CAEEX|nr:hypothetical protein CEXT_275621 [Caerostris extrusa]